MQQEAKNTNSRRSVLLGLGAAVAGATVVSARSVNAQTGSSGFQPARHQVDAWFDEIPGEHRVFIDTATANGGAEGILYAGNLWNARRTAYAGESADFAMVLCFRHLSTPFAFNDAIWEKYGQVFNALMQMPDPNTGVAPTFNLMRSAEYGLRLPNLGTTLDQVIDLGVQIAICDAATQFVSNQIAQATGGSLEIIYGELKNNAISGRFVSAGVMALTRAQEYGYSVLIAG
ncbi:MAG: hypothetical protein R3F41_07350 [Gammaproteobacteria bacterium]|nr:hypothetical protein [Pseudomonadales bacterium]MCP5348736.1 hypothetical protein [Pseudomonadales bacterium]